MSLLWLIILSIFSLLYFMFSMILYWGLNRKYETLPPENPSVSVIVAARNEANNIEDCLFSLALLNYPEDRLEILIVNDRSEDDTDNIISRFVKDKPQFRYFHLEKALPHLSGKASAISQAIQKSQGKIIFITDADCIVPVNWVQKMTAYFNDDTGLVASFTLTNFSRGLFCKLQTLDWGYLLSVASGAAGVGIPLTCMGNNFAFRRAAYDEVGGYEGVGFSITEDFALLKAIAQQTDWKIAFPIDAECLVKSKPAKTLKEFFSQRKRWATGGRSVHWFGKTLIVTSLTTHFILLAFILSNQNYLASIASLMIILFSDYLILRLPLNLSNSKTYFKYLPSYKIFFLFYSIIVLIQSLVQPTMTWKGIQYTTNQASRHELWKR